MTPKLLTVSENGLPITIESGMERAVDILLEEVITSVLGREGGERGRGEREGGWEEGEGSEGGEG